MCIIAVKPKGVKITDQIMNVLENCWIWNPDGAGLMTPSANGISISKGFMDWDDLEQYLEVYNEELSDSQVVFHFRWATHGLTNQENCHPFPITSDIDLLTSLEVDSKIGMVHNGIIDRCADVNSKISDTMKFCKFISNLPNNFTGNKSMIELITGYIGTDKMIFLNRNGDVKIVNENKGIWKDGNWYSNGNWDYTRKKWYQRQTELNNRIMENVELHRGGRWDTSEEYGIIENEIVNDDIARCTDCDEVIGKYEDHDYDGRCYSCWRLETETARYYGDF